MGLDIIDLMKDLARDRPIFHSEADFQHALAWHIHEALPDCQVRLEFEPSLAGKRMYLDIWLLSRKVAIELKYRTRELHSEIAGESFALRDQAAQPLGRYDFIKDIQRLEQVVDDGPAEAAFAVLLTNDPSYWKPLQQPDVVDAAFRLHKDRRIMGEMAWASRASRGTTKDREKPLCLKGSYDCVWRDYSSLGEGKFRKFRYLMVKVP